MKYFAYGTNIDSIEMEDRCPGAVEVGTAVLSNYGFLINSRGVATVVPTEGKIVYGVLWSVSSDHLITLDDYEGVHFGTYRREPIKVVFNDEDLEAEIYLAADLRPGHPRGDYLKRIVASATKRSFPESYIQELEQWQKTGE